MKKTSTGPILALFLALLLLLPALLLLFGLALPPQYGETFLGELKHKVSLLRSTPGPRIVLVGGSSIPFGVRSDLMESVLPGYRVVDFGMYADMGSVVMLDWAASEAREGDIFVVMPEQAPLTLSCYVNGEDVWQAADGAFQLLSSLAPSRRETLAAAFPAFAGKKLTYALTGPPTPQGVYARSSFNAYGDIDYPHRGANILPGGYDPNVPISFSPNVLDGGFAEELNSFARAVTAQGAKVVYHFPPMNSAALAAGTAAADVDSYYDYLNGLLLFPILGDPHRCLMDAGWFYDTNFHLNASGAIVFTKTLAEDLKLYLKDTSPTPIPLPAMPLPSSTAVVGDDADAPCFTYRQTGEGWIIDGLTPQGAARERLTLPTRWQDAPVVGLDAQVFWGNTALRELTVQSNIRVLYDGMFRQCTAFRRLILTSDDPSAYTVGDGLREGADFLIYVPAHALEGYRQSYSWHQYDVYLWRYEQ